MTECIALFEQRRGEEPEYKDGFEERTLKAAEAMQPMVETIPLHAKDNWTWEEELTYERQFREMLLELGDKGYDIMPEIIRELAQTGLAIYEENVK